MVARKMPNAQQMWHKCCLVPGCLLRLSLMSAIQQTLTSCKVDTAQLVGCCVHVTIKAEVTWVGARFLNL